MSNELFNEKLILWRMTVCQRLRTLTGYLKTRKHVEITCQLQFTKEFNRYVSSPFQDRGTFDLSVADFVPDSSLHEPMSSYDRPAMEYKPRPLNNAFAIHCKLPFSRIKQANIMYSRPRNSQMANPKGLHAALSEAWC